MPDSLVGTPIICSYCGQQVVVMADAPLMPPPLPGSAPAATPEPAIPLPSAAPEPPRGPTPKPLPPTRRTIAGPAAPRGAMPAAPPPGPPPAPLTPPRAAPAQGHEPAQAEPYLETYERARKLQKSPIWPWIVAGVFAVAVLVVVVVMLVTKSPNPDPATISLRLSPNPSMVAVLGPRQTGVGYSLQLPADFAAAAVPTTAGLPSGTQSFAWVAKAGTEGAGSQCRLWVIPRSLGIEKELDDLHAMGGLLDHQVSIKDKSSCHRLGATMLCVRGLLEGTDAGEVRKGVIYLIADGRKTLMIAGLGTGPKADEMRVLLDHAIRTIERAAPSATK